MKKKTILLSAILVIGVTMFFSSCSKKDKSCKCEIEGIYYDYYGDKYTDKETEKYDEQDLKRYKVKTCADLESIVEGEYEDEYGDDYDKFEVSCDAR